MLGSGSGPSSSESDNSGKDKVENNSVVSLPSLAGSGRHPEDWLISSAIICLKMLYIIDYDKLILPRNVSNVVESGCGFSSLRLTRGVMVNRGGLSVLVRLFRALAP